MNESINIEKYFAATSIEYWTMVSSLKVPIKEYP
jgi:hypothetical protein